MKNCLKRSLFAIATLFLGIGSLGADSVKAIKKECSAILQMNSLYTQAGNNYYYMQVDGARALCVDPGLAASSGRIYTKSNYNASDLTATQRKAIVWDLDKFELPSKTKEELMRSAGHNNLNEVTIDFALRMNGYGNYEGSSQEIMASFNSTQDPGDNGLVVLGAGAGEQRMLTLANKIDCMEDKKQSSCPGGNMVKNGSIGTCYTQKGGIDQAFSYTATAGSSSNVHRQYGEQYGNSISQYCKLYCQEYGSAILPGATGEALTLGTYMIWPTSSGNYNNSKFQENFYPLKFKGNLHCRLGVMPDKEMPGMNGECTADPIEDYRKAWNQVNSKYTTRDFNSITLEQNRKEIGRQIGKSSDAIRGVFVNYYSTGGKGCSVYGGGADTKCLDKANKKLAEAQKEFDKAHKAAEEIEPKKQFREVTINVNGNVRKEISGMENTPEYDKALGVMEEKRKDVEKWENTINGINAQINTNTSYVVSFEYATAILEEMFKCGDYSIDESLYNGFNVNVSMSYTDKGKEYSVAPDIIKVNSSSSYESAPTVAVPKGYDISDVLVVIAETPTIFEGQVKGIKAREFDVKKEETYGLSTPYKYINKENTKYSKTNPGKNYIDLTRNSTIKSVIPTSYSNPVGDKDAAELVLSGIKFGKAGFGNGETYVCKQEFKKYSDECVCPENTKMAGKILTGYIEDNHETCADAQMKYCDEGEKPTTNLYCDPPMENIPIISCINSGYTAEECKSKICPNIKKPIKCKNTNGVGGEMDITSCVEVKMMQGSTLQQAIDACDALICPIGKTIIYRTIKLENPFPGKNISKIAQGFNNDVIGRYPGTNWNGLLTVYNKIRNNREHDTNSEVIAKTATSTSGSTIYQTKTPLYTFVLNGVTIKNIRDYNDKQKDGYNDFKLECKTNHSSGCISSFVHNKTYSGITGGTCSNISLNNSFYRCAD